MLTEQQPQGHTPLTALLPQLQHLTHGSPMWVNAASSLAWGPLHDAATMLLAKLEAALHPRAVHTGWLTSQEKPADRSALREPLSRQKVQLSVVPGSSTNRLTLVGNATTAKCCMPIMLDSVGRAGQYMSATSKGYINVDFGRGTLLKKWGRGYKRVHKQRVQLGAHQVVCWLFKGPPPNGQVCAHLCGHPNCINPFHLGYFSHSDNALMRGYHGSTGRGHLWPAAS